MPPLLDEARRSSRADGAETRQRILEAAQRCAARRGWEATRLREVAAEAGVGKGLVVYHFGSKDGLFAATKALVFEALAARVAAAVERAGPTRRTTKWAVGELVRTTLETQREVLPLVLELWSVALRDPAARRIAAKERAWLRGMLVESLRRMVGDDVTRLPLSLDATADLVEAVLTGALLASALDEDPARVRRSLAEIEAHAGALLAPRRRTPRPRTTKRGPRGTARPRRPR